MKKYLLLLMLALAQLTSAQTSDMQQLFRGFKAAANFDHEYPREKVYLHFDNNGYYEDETIWFKAYVMRASSLRPTNLSKVLYVELLKDDGRLIERKLLQLDAQGQANGEFKLELPIKAGFFEIRAYTREMVNWGPEACFSRVLPVFKKPVSKRKKKIELEDINANALDIDLPEAKGRNEHLDDANASKTLLNFFPESGNRVAGVMQRMAYQLTDGRGAPISASIQIFNAKGELLTTTETEHQGMGSFQLPADFGEGGYAEVRGERFDLPAVEAGQEYALQAVPDEGGMMVYVSPAPTAEPELLGLVIHCRDKMCYLDTLTLQHEPIGLFVSNQSLHGGINRIELVNKYGQSLCRRLVWKAVPERRLHLNIRQNKKIYDQYTPVALEMDLKDGMGRPVSTTFSLAVRDSEGDLVRATTPSAGADILLSSELKGYIHQPDFYFEKDDAAHRRALDLLLMVQGWSANNYATMCGATPFNLQQPIEERLTLNGHAYEYDSDKLIPYPNLKLKVKMYAPKGGALEAEAVTDEEGKFAFASNVDYCGEWIAQITTLDEGQKKWSRIALDRWFSPETLPLDYYQTQLEAPMPRVYNAGADTIKDLFTWQDTVSDKHSILLGTAEIKAKKKYKGFTGNRYTYNGGEKGGMRQSDEFYNIEMEVERYKDSGKIPGSIQSFMAELSSEFNVREENEAADNYIDNESDRINYNEGRDNSNGINGEANDHTQSTSYITYNGRRIQTFYNNSNEPINSNYSGGLPAEFVKSVAIVKSRSRKEHITDFEFNDKHFLNNSDNSKSCNDFDPNTFLFIYELPDANRYRTEKGVEKRRIWGYSQPTKFYKPNYAGFDKPSKKDVRRTLYWNPSVKTDANGKASVVFFTNCREDVELRISARGVTMDGRMVNAEK